MNFYNQKFLRHLESVCQQHHIKIYIDYTKKIFQDGQTTFLGSFNPDQKLLLVAGGAKNYFQTIVHESCHLFQWIQNPAFYKNCDYSSLYNWIEGSHNNRESAERAMLHYCIIERDVAKRGLALIEEFKLPIDPIRWTKCHNLDFTWAVLQFQARRPIPSSYEYPRSLISVMPKHLEYFPEYSIPDKIKKAVISYIGKD